MNIAIINYTLGVPNTSNDAYEEKCVESDFHPVWAYKEFCFDFDKDKRIRHSQYFLFATHVKGYKVHVSCIGLN